MKKKQTEDGVLSVRNSQLKEIWRRFKKNRTAMIGLAILGLFIVVLVFGNLIAPPELISLQDYSISAQKPSAEHWFGTDVYGRDIFSRVIHGTKYSFGIAIAITAASTLIGLIIGTLTAYKGGIVDQVVMRLMDIITSIPSLLFAMCIVAVMGTSPFSLFVSLSISTSPATARIVRTALLNVVGSEYVEACRACGTSAFRMLTKHVIPNALGPVIVAATMSVATNILACATLSFIGLGFQEPTPEWGAMLSMAREYFTTHFYMMISPCVAIALASLSINLIGDGLRDALDPKLRD